MVRFLEVGVKTLDFEAVKEIFVGYGRTRDSTVCIIQLLVRLVIREMCHLTKKNFLALETVFQITVSFCQNPRVSSLDVEEEQVVSSKPLKSVAEKDDSRTRETSPVPEYSTSNSNPDFYAEFRTRSGRHVKAVERYGCPIDNSEKFSFVESFSCEEVPNSLEEVKKSQSRDE